MDEEKKTEDLEKFSFIREKIKEKPLSRKKVLTAAGVTVLLAVLFGLVSAATFTVVQPRLQKKLNPQKPDQVTFPEDEDGTDAADGEDADAEVQDPVIIQEKVELQLSDYASLFSKMSALAASSSRSLVTVTSATDETDWFNELLESKTHGTGVLIADNGMEYLILTEQRIVKGADRISVTFSDTAVAEAQVKAYDGNTGLAVLCVNKKDLEESTKKVISIAELGNSNLVKKGAPIIAAGSPMEYDNAAMFGNITSQSNSVAKADASYQILTTDIIGSTNGTGVLLNLDGQVVGIISQEAGADLQPGTVTAFAVSDIKSLIEKLSNGGEIAYAGIRGKDVTAAIAEASGMPKGVYVSVDMDSPAMQAGIQNGDIITAVNNVPVENMKTIQNYLLDFSPEQALNLTIMRQGKDEYVEMNYVVTLGQLK